MEHFKYFSSASRCSVRAQTSHNGRIVWSILFDNGNKTTVLLLILKINKNLFILKIQTIEAYGKMAANLDVKAVGTAALSGTCKTRCAVAIHDGKKPNEAADDQKASFVNSL